MESVKDTRSSVRMNELNESEKQSVWYWPCRGVTRMADGKSECWSSKHNHGITDRANRVEPFFHTDWGSWRFPARFLVLFPTLTSHGSTMIHQPRYGYNTLLLSLSLMTVSSCEDMPKISYPKTISCRVDDNNCISISFFQIQTDSSVKSADDRVNQLYTKILESISKYKFIY